MTILKAVALITYNMYSKGFLARKNPNINTVQKEVQKLHPKTLSLNSHLNSLNFFTRPPLNIKNSGPSFSFKIFVNTAIKANIVIC